MAAYRWLKRSSVRLRHFIESWRAKTQTLVALRFCELQFSGGVQKDRGDPIKSKFVETLSPVSLLLETIQELAMNELRSKV